MTQEFVRDLATWVVMVAGAAVGAAINQDWTNTHGRLAGAMTILMVVGAGLKTLPPFPARAPKPAPAAAPAAA